ncbi:hypothetical protein ANN_26669 [Periplaneta americana]|uniref:Uncharacterized protein n=1 Tax=Periplaneta americana TaxID=6978 RepID=A0ABQ8RZ90_PERAM|nr:hypothetical protein ANN_26669 [Periplaneta americana]
MAGLCVGGNEPSGSLKAICKMDHRRWTHRLTLWDPSIGRRRVERQTTRWADFFKKKAGAHWTSSTRDRQLWRNLEATVLSV